MSSVEDKDQLSVSAIDKKMKSVKIVDISSDEVIQHIVPLKDSDIKLKRKKSTADTKKEVTYTPSFLSSSKRKSNKGDGSEDEADAYMLPTPAGATDENGDGEDVMDGQNVFQFRTPKKSGQMALKAMEGLSPSVVKNSPRKSFSSPAKNLVKPVERTPPRSTSTSLDRGVLTPLQSRGVAAVREHNRMESSTPYRLRKRNVPEQQESSSDDDSVDESSEGEEEDLKKLQSNTVHKNDGVDSVASAEAYFDLHSHAPVTSDRTLASLGGPRLDVDTVRSVLAKVTPGHSKECQTLMEKYTKLIDKWMLQMCCGFNILLHGLGSKRDLLELFRVKQLKKFSHLVVNGYFPSLTVKHILNSITEDILDSNKGFTNVHTQLEFIKQEYSSRDEDVYLLIHNIDGALLRSEKNQAILSHLAEIKGFHIIASLDHINAAFMWDQAKYFRFRWLWYETPTFAPYEAENWYENSLLVQQSGGLALSSLTHVMCSLTPNARNIFLELAKYQLENSDNSNYPGMSFQTLYHKCREAFLVNSDLTLQAQLVEFKDHRMLRAKKNFEGVEHLTIPIDKTTLMEFLQDYGS